MFQFTLKSMLAAVAVVALWLSSFSEYALTSDVRKSMLLFTFLASGFAAIYNQGRRRAFWAGFFTTMLLCGGLSLERPLHRYTPDFPIQVSSAPPTPTMNAFIAPGTYYVPPSNVAMQPGGYMGGGVFIPTQSKFDLILSTSISTVWTLALAVMIGFAAATIYDQGQKNKDG